MNKRDWTPYIGRKINHLEIVDIKHVTNKQGHNKSKFLCCCDCGNYKLMDPYSVVGGKSKTCGCGAISSRYGREHKKDISGDRFGKITVVSDSGKRAANGSVVWECLCDCGATVELPASSLTRGYATSCGCDKVHQNTKNIVGKVFGFLTVADIDRGRERKKGDKLRWACDCICGNRISVTTSDLTSGNTMSCGCMQMSSHEQHIANLLDYVGLKYERQKRFCDCKNIKPLPFDFYIPELNVALEYDGRQHYEPVEIFNGDYGFERTRRSDAIKDKYCQDNGIQLIRIPYTMNNTEICEIINTLKTRNE